MASNFTFLKTEWLEIAESARSAEKNARTDYATACFHARRTLELAVNWIYDHDEELTAPYDDNLSSLIFADDFRNNLNPALFTKIDYIRKVGNQAVHGTRKINEHEAVRTVQELFHFLYWLARTYTQGDVKQFDELKFDEKLVPLRQVSVSVNTYKKLKEIDERYKAEQEAEKLKKQQLTEKPDIDAELQRLRKQITAAKHKNQKYPDSHNYSEAETRKNIIDLMITEAGWKIGKDCTFELEIKGMPNKENIGFIDYVLWGSDGKPLAVIEAKRTAKGAEAGKQQAKLYADCVEAEYGRRPVIFYTNGYEIFIWDDFKYPPRQIQGFYTKDELELMIQRRQTRKNLSAENINEEIVNRHYQKRAISRVAENFQDNNARKSLIVMATGAGKTRTVIALCDLLLKANWAKRILFLADRVALVKQACNAFKKHLPNANPVNLVTEKEETGSRVYVSTYPTMMGQINQLEGDIRRFGVGYFDLIVIDEAHRSVYQKYKAIFEYFDSYLVGLTATPKAEVDRNTYRLFDLQNGLPTDSYELDEAVKDGYLVPSINISHATKFISEGIKYSDLSDEEKE
ncbi:MAG: DEAD/DEAH box helicase family protein, partial [Acidobacteriota bacterium]